MSECNVKHGTVFARDNIDILRGMNSDCVDLIYLDPPFNSNRHYIAPIGSEAAGAAFKDTWTLDDVDEAWVDMIAEESEALAAIIKAIDLVRGDGTQSYLSYMAIRLIEMHRILKHSGSIYLHCDQNEGHALNLLMDSIFGKDNFRNDITWRRTPSDAKGSQHAPKSWGKNADNLLYYGKTHAADIVPVQELTPEEEVSMFKYVDDDGRRYNYPYNLHRSPGMGDRPNLCYEWRGFTNRHASGWRLSKDRMEQEYQKGNVVILPNGTLQRRKYVDDYVGKPLGDLWMDIPGGGGLKAHESTKYKT